MAATSAPVLECAFHVRLGDGVVAPSFEAPSGITVLFGPSGAGKTVTLRAVAGLLRPEEGRIRYNGRTFFDAASGAWEPPGARHVGYVPQSLALYPHMTVAENVAFAAGRSDGASTEQVRRVLSLLGIDELAARRPATLSGGQQQRAALARALSREGVRLLLLDEPLSALDEALRERLRRELLALRAEVGFDALFITHDLREAFMLADWMVLMDGGRVIRSGPRDEVFAHPGHRRVAELLGFANLLTGVVVERSADTLVVDVEGVRLRSDAGPQHEGIAVGTPVDVAVRREEVLLHRGVPERAAATNLVEMRIDEEIPYGAGSILRLHGPAAGFRLESDVPVRPYRVLRVDERREWLVEVAPTSIHVMPVGEPEDVTGRG